MNQMNLAKNLQYASNQWIRSMSITNTVDFNCVWTLCIALCERCKFRNDIHNSQDSNCIGSVREIYKSNIIVHTQEVWYVCWTRSESSLFQMACCMARIGMELILVKLLTTFAFPSVLFIILKCFRLTGEVAPAKVSSRESTRAPSEHDQLTVVGLLLEDPSMCLSDVSENNDAYWYWSISSYYMLDYSSKRIYP